MSACMAVEVAECVFGLSVLGTSEIALGPPQLIQCFQPPVDRVFWCRATPVVRSEIVPGLS